MSENTNAAAVLDEIAGAPAPETAEPVVEVKAKPKVKAKAAKAKPKAEPKKPAAPKKPGPKTAALEFQSNTQHEAKGGGSIEVVGTRVSYLVRQTNGRLRWFSGTAVKAMVKAAPAPEPKAEEPVAAAAAV